ncbi:MAG: hypothetical protein M3P50_10600 [Actinomycetota bacterium]|nr:hypothetical protein [Actinomycetota bacterium]
MILPAPLRLLAALSAVLLLAACGGSDGRGGDRPQRAAPVLGGSADEPEAAEGLGFPAFATKNTTRIGGADPVVDAAGVAQAVFPARSRETRPAAVTLVDRNDWRAAISAAQLMNRPLRAPILFTDGDRFPPVTQAALDALEPTGAKQAGGAQVLRVGNAPRPDGLKARDLAGADYAAQARAIDRLHTAATGGTPGRSVIVADAGEPALAMPAAGYAAKSGTPVLWVDGEQIPAETRAAIRDHGKPRIYLLGAESAIPKAVATELGRLGRVQRITGRDPIAAAVQFATWPTRARAPLDPNFGWRVSDPGHGFVFASPERPADAAAAAPLSAAGSYGPLLLVSKPGALDKVVEQYLLDVQPGYDKDPVRGVYNHGWLMGDESAISVDVQSRIDALLEIEPVDRSAAN